MDDLLDLDFNATTTTSSKPTSTKPFQPPASTAQNTFRSNSPSLSNNASQKPNANYAAFSNLNISSPTISNVPSRSGTPSTFNSTLAGNLPRSSTPQQAGAAKEDSFARLFGSKNGVSGAGDLSKLSLGERQRILNEEKAKTSGHASISEDDLLAAFSADAPVNAATRFPPEKSSSMSSSRQESVSSARPTRSTPRVLETSMKAPALEEEAPADDDDPFGLGMGPSKPQVRAQQRVQTNRTNGRIHADDEDEDVLGLLGRPVAEVRAQSIPRTDTPRRRSPSDDEPSDAVLGVTPRDRMVAEIVEMGFPLQRASEALDAVGEESGVQGAISYLLNAAHAEARKESHPQMRRSPSREQDSRKPQTDARAKDPSQRAQELGKTFLSTANSLWKTGTKNIKKAVADFQEAQNQTSNTNGDSDLPKWMRNTASTGGREANGRANPGVEGEDRTDEAMMLEAREESTRPTRRTESRPDPEELFSRSSRRRQETLFDQEEPIRRDTSRSSVPQVPAQSQSRVRDLQDAARNEGTTAYVSPARRKKPAPAPKPAEPEEDIFAPAPRKQTISAPQPSTSSPKPQPRPKPATTTRPIPTVSQHALKTSHKHRFAGTTSFKLGNYSAATESYSSSLSSLPSTHPLYIIILTNRALTHLKTGDPKSSITDADAAISRIGPSKGLNETVDLEDENGTVAKKDMYEYYGKAMMRRAEALEQLEKWDEAAQVWKQCVEGNIGGAVSAKGRERCERAIATHRNPAPAINGARLVQQSRPAQQTQPKKSTVPRTSAATQAASIAKSREAVTKLRAANEAANAAEDEKFALSDAVSGRVEAWRKGKEGNLRALLASLDNVLWEGSGWKKVGMGELIMPNKVKVVYMKGIGKCHPDKLSQGATTEQVMIAGSVFSTLNEAWDKFKAENGL